MELAEFQRLYANRRREFSWIDLRGQDLTGMNLANVILRESNLESAILAGANLQNARLPKANLHRANLKGANLSHAKLKGANLSHANLSGANLTGAEFHSSNLTGANLDGAILVGANFCNAILTGVNWGNADRTHAIFDHPESIPCQETTNSTSALPVFVEKWHYRPEELLTLEQKLALSPLLWLIFVFGCYLYQGFAWFRFLKQGFSWLFALLSCTAPLLWLVSSELYWSYPALLLGIIFATSFDIFSFFFLIIAFAFSFRATVRYRVSLDKVQFTAFRQMPAQWQRRVIRDTLALGSGVVAFITIFRTFFFQPAVAVFLLCSAITALAGAIALNLMRQQQKLSPWLSWSLVSLTSWLGAGAGFLLFRFSK